MNPQPLISVRCATCGAFAEALAYAGAVGPLTQTTLVEHETCDLLQLHSQLSAAAREFADEWRHLGVASDSQYASEPPPARVW